MELFLQQSETGCNCITVPGDDDVPEISVVIPVYNTGAILQETIDSVLNQSFQDFEVIIVDDGSADQKTVEILDRQCDRRIKIFHQSNAGVAAARNKGIKLSKGKYIAFLDHDDIFLPEKLMISRNIFNLYENTDAVYSGLIPFGDCHNKAVALEYPEGRIFDKILAQNPILSMSCTMVKKTFVELYKINFESFYIPCDDWDFHLQCALYGNIRCAENPLIKYRFHDGNQSADQTKMYDAGIRVINKYQKMLPEISRDTGIARRILQKSINHTAFRHHYGLAFQQICSRKYKKAVGHIFRSFRYRPVLFLKKIISFMLQTVVKQIRKHCLTRL